ncbi:SGNH hydrolase-type esterase domain-containing protein [Lasiosphaeria ovina]|uniref:SGNH hydrolase-type esterase domain-containing protein n=1 Tax=Lasiosphaeria ovina TaxID=92902 RepID=A0AAE0JR92_9PEZI|nr:SGNH hydrolase-type esterase domain-containing protein [Lasiosphaeria ovina]
MPLGDSITGSPGCWRALLWRKLQAAGVTNTKFVGTAGAGAGSRTTGANEGHGGSWRRASWPTSSCRAAGADAPGRRHDASRHQRRLDNKPADDILAAFSAMVDWMRASKPGMKILVAQIIPMNPPNCKDCGARVVALNKAIPAWAANATSPASPVTVVDCWTGFDPAKDTGDGVHPNSAGNEKMATCWFAPLVAAIKG